MNKKLIGAGIIVVVLAVVGMYIGNRSTAPSSETQLEQVDSKLSDTTPKPLVVADSKVTTESEVKIEKPTVAPKILPKGAPTLQKSVPVPAPAQVGKVFTIAGTSFAYSPATIKVQKGDAVKIVFKDNDGFHDLVIDGIGTTKRISTGEESSFEFTADKVGSFEYYCSVGSHRQKGMSGTLIVE